MSHVHSFPPDAPDECVDCGTMRSEVGPDWARTVGESAKSCAAAHFDPIGPLELDRTYAVHMDVPITPRDARDIAERGRAVGIRLLVLAPGVTIEAAPEMDRLREDLDHASAANASLRSMLADMRNLTRENERLRSQTTLLASQRDDAQRKATAALADVDRLRSLLAEALDLLAEDLPSQIRRELGPGTDNDRVQPSGPVAWNVACWIQETIAPPFVDRIRREAGLS